MIRLILGAILILLASPASGSADSGKDVAEGLSWMHSFEYERALAAFERAEKSDPRNAMAYWGQAMCCQQLLWGNENVEEARTILGCLRRSGAIRASSHDVEGALALLADAIRAERALPASIGPPALIEPAQEQYAEQLALVGRLERAVAQYDGARERAPNRRLSLEGRQRAAGAIRDAKTPALIAIRRRRAPSA